MNEPRAKKRFGQNFLHDPNVIASIVAALNPQPNDRLVEIGPGPAALTRPLLERVQHLHVIEIDRDLAAELPQRAGVDRPQAGQLSICTEDALKVDFSQLGAPEASNQPLRLIGNLPYNISTPILFHCLQWRHCIQDAHFMLQKEVVERMAANPGNKTYGRLSVMLQAYCRVEALFDVGPGAFKPAPKVTSAVARISPLPNEQVNISDHQRFEIIVKAAFGQRRKTLRNTLKGVVSEQQLEQADINPSERAEQLSVEQFVALAEMA